MHLRVLKDAALVRRASEGNDRIHQLDPAGRAALRNPLDRDRTRALASFGQAA